MEGYILGAVKSRVRNCRVRFSKEYEVEQKIGSIYSLTPELNTLM
jgi:hypothetical protein